MATRQLDTNLKALIDFIINKETGPGQGNDERYEAIKKSIKKYLILSDKEYEQVIEYVAKKLNT